jgi:ATP-dependent Clp protease ATP-binding subunit ClpA
MSLNLTENLNAKVQRVHHLPASRQEAAQKIHEILTRYQCNNPVLLGEPGCGKSYFLQQFAALVAQNQDEKIFKGLCVRRLNVDDLHMKRADIFAESVERIFVAAETSSRKTLLFLDQMESLFKRDQVAWLQLLRLSKHVMQRGRFYLGFVCNDDFYYEHLSTQIFVQTYADPVSLPSLNDKEVLGVLSEGLLENSEAKKLVSDEALLLSVIHLSKRFVESLALPQSAFLLIDKTLAALKMQKKQNETHQLREEDFINVLAGWFGVYVEKQAYYDQALLNNAESVLLKSIVGQDAAITRLSELLPTCLNKSTGLPCFIFSGNESIGKFKAALSLHKFLFGHHAQPLMLDLSYLKAGELNSLVLNHYKNWHQGTIICLSAQNAEASVLQEVYNMISEAKINASRSNVRTLEDFIVVMTYDREDQSKHEAIDLKIDKAPAQEKKEESLLQLVVSDLPSIEINEFDLNVEESHQKHLHLPEYLLDLSEVVDFESLSFKAFSSIVKDCLDQVAHQFLLRNTMTLKYKDNFIEQYIGRFDQSKVTAEFLINQLKNEIALLFKEQGDLDLLKDKVTTLTLKHNKLSII